MNAAIAETFAKGNFFGVFIFPYFHCTNTNVNYYILTKTVKTYAWNYHYNNKLFAAIN